MKRKKQIETNKVQDELIAASKKQSLLQEFGGNVWRSMWTQANAYINLIESGERGMPVSQTDRCALCQQELDDLAKARMQRFKEFCDSKAMADAQRLIVISRRLSVFYRIELKTQLTLYKLKSR